MCKKQYRHMKQCIKGLLLVLFAVVAQVADARPQLHRLDIHVVLRHNGDALITERREMSIDEEGTECYIGLANMGESTVKNLRVTDESEQEYENVGEWDVDRSRDWKAGKCGIVTKSKGYELCWGLGDSGERTYITEYIITGLVRSYPDADAIRHVFMDTSVSPKPESASVTIESEDSLMFSSENSGVWGFRFGGDVGFRDGKIVVTNSEPFGSEGGLYVMVRFDKGMFEPTVSEEDTFENKKEEAFQGSDYSSDDEEDLTFEDWCSVIFVLLLFFYGAIEGVWNIINIWRARRKVFKNLTWYRDIPLEGDLQEANNILNAYRYTGSNYNNLLSACILKLINMGIITIEKRQNRSGKLRQNFVIQPLEDTSDMPKLMCKVYDIFRSAAGEDTVLETRELREYVDSKRNAGIMESFVSMLHSKTSVSKYSKRLTDVQQVFGLKKYLEEFSLLNERGVQEIALWKDYMIYATLFGIAEQVIKDMKSINPEYFKMDKIAAQIADDMTIPAINSIFSSGAARAAARKAAREAQKARSSGHGGRSSWGGGGGGFSGGGGGGGVR